MQTFNVARGLGQSNVNNVNNESIDEIQINSLQQRLTMASPNTTPRMNRLHLSDDDEDTEDLWDSPSTRASKARQRLQEVQAASTVQQQPRYNDAHLTAEEAREAALQKELQSVRSINQIIEGVLESLEKAKGNMEVRILQSVDSTVPA